MGREGLRLNIKVTKPFKGYVHLKTVTSQNMSSAVQVKNFSIS